MRHHASSWILSSCRRTAPLVAMLVLVLPGCGAEPQHAGQYRIATRSDGLFGLRCQPRTEFYFVDPARPEAAPMYLGTCSTPRFVVEHRGVSINPSCFAVAEDGTALVYFHLQNWCGAGAAAREKRGGVYLHSVADGDRMLYEEGTQVRQAWVREAREPGAMLVGWINAQPSRGGAVCAQKLIIRSDGSETPLGEPETVHGCAAGRVPESSGGR